LGNGAKAFVDFLARAGQRRWQVLPLGPTGFGDSPYACFSSFAGNPLLIDPDQMAADGYLDWADVSDGQDGDATLVDYGVVIGRRHALLDVAYGRFLEQPPEGARERFSAFCEAEAGWLDDYALFAALKSHHDGAPWYQWEIALKTRQPEALMDWRQRLSDAMDAVRFQQFLFFDQWQRIRRYASERRVKIIGDLPIYVPMDSVDVWVNQSLFKLDDEGNPQVVAGVPPDYFSETGQLWGNPVYDWAAHEADGYRWWISRINAQLRMVDVLRLDHFRGFADYWEVPAEDTVASNGRWVDGPGMALFDALAAALGGDLPIIAEDLGIITEAVTELRDSAGLPGMAVLQFAFDSDARNLHLPHWHVPNQVVYTGTHDNDTTVGWYLGLDDDRRRFADCYLEGSGEGIHRVLIRQALASVARTAIFPMQDVLGLPGEARMNQPGRAGGNWAWRLEEKQLDDGLADALRDLTHLYGRA
jgi:4-alpha-glucanotransferase